MQWEEQELQWHTQIMFEENDRIIDKEEKIALENIRANAEVYTLTVDERQAFVEATGGVYQEYMDRGILTKEELKQMERIIKGHN